MGFIVGFLLAFLLGMLFDARLSSSVKASAANTCLADSSKAETKPAPRSICQSILDVATNKTLKHASDTCTNLIATNLNSRCNASLDEHEIQENRNFLDETNQVTLGFSMHHTIKAYHYYLSVVKEQTMGALQSADNGHLALTKSHASSIEYSTDAQITPSNELYDSGVQTVQHMRQAQWQAQAKFVLHGLVPAATTLFVSWSTVGGPIAVVKAVNNLGGFLATFSHIVTTYKFASGLSMGTSVIAGMWDIGGYFKGQGTTFLNWYDTKITDTAKVIRCLLASTHNECIDDLDDGKAVSKFTRTMRTEIDSDHLVDIRAFTKVMQVATKAICRQTPIGKQDLLNLLMQHNTSKTQLFYEECVTVLASKRQENRANWLTMGNISKQLPVVYNNQPMLPGHNMVGNVEETCKRLSQFPVHVLQPWFQSHQQIITDVLRVKDDFYDVLDGYESWKHDDKIQEYKEYLDTLARMKTCDHERLSALLRNASLFDIYRRSIPEMVVGTDYMSSSTSVFEETMNRLNKPDLLQIFF